MLRMMESGRAASSLNVCGSTSCVSEGPSLGGMAVKGVQGSDGSVSSGTFKGAPVKATEEAFACTVFAGGAGFLVGRAS